MTASTNIGWTLADDALLTTLREANVTFEKIQPVLSRYRSIEALKSRIYKLAHPGHYARKMAQQAISNRNRRDRRRYGTEYGYHAQEWPEEARFTSMVMK